MYRRYPAPVCRIYTLDLSKPVALCGWVRFAGEPNVEGFSDTVIAAVHELMKSVVGQDASRIQYIYQKLYRQKFYVSCAGPILMSAIAGIDQVRPCTVH